jgi:iron complex outermembrane recepter protein
MDQKKLLILFFTSNLVFATEEIPLIKVFPRNNYISYKTASSLNTQSQVQVISNKQFTASGSPSLSDVLNSQAGVQIIEPNGASNRAVFSMRGFGGNAISNVLVLFDGQPYFNPDMGTPMFNISSLAEVKQIEVTPSSASVLYGDQAVGGVINIITKEPETKTSEAAISYGSFATNQVRFALGNVKKNTFGYRVGGSTYSSNNYREHNAERNNNLSVDMIYQNIYFRYHKANQHLEMPGKLTWEQVEQNPRQAENNVAYNNQDHDVFQLGLKHYMGANWSAMLDTSTRLMQGVGAYVFNQQAMGFNESRQVVTIQPKISGVVNLCKYSIFPIFGIDLNYGGYEINSSHAQQNQNALYGQVTIPLTRKVTAVFGSRYGLAFYHLSPDTAVKTDPINRAFITDLELSWQPLNNLRLFAKRAESFRFPKTDEIMFTIDKSPLKPQAGVSYEAGAICKNNNFSGSLSIYQLDLKNEIFAVPVATSNYFVYNKNLDPTRRVGAILGLSLDPIKYLQLNANYNFVNAKFLFGDFAGKNMPFVASNSLRLAAILKPYKTLQILVEGIYTGGRYPINDVENRSTKLGGFTIYNCGISYEKQHYILTLRGNNLTNKFYYGYSVVTYQGTSNTNWYYPSAGFNVLATLTLKL